MLCTIVFAWKAFIFQTWITTQFFSRRCSALVSCHTYSGRRNECNTISGESWKVLVSWLLNLFLCKSAVSHKAIFPQLQLLVVADLPKEICGLPKSIFRWPCIPAQQSYFWCCFPIGIFSFPWPFYTVFGHSDSWETKILHYKLRTLQVVCIYPVKNSCIRKTPNREGQCNYLLVTDVTSSLFQVGADLRNLQSKSDI